MNIRTFKDEDADVGELELEGLRVGALESWSAYGILEQTQASFWRAALVRFR